ncbi:MAG: hypothetical protein ACE5E1_08075 [Phycisphaerae bacterium]
MQKEVESVVWKKIKSAAAVVSITLLIWYAADQNVSEQELFSITVRVKSADPNRYAGLAEYPYKQALAVTLHGTRSRLREFNELARSRDVFVVEVDRSRPSGPATQALSTVDDIVRRIPEIRELRLSVRSVRPETLEARIDDYITLDHVRIQPDYGDLQVEAKRSRDTVSVRLPAFIARQLGDDPVATAPAEQAIRTAVADTRSDRFRVTVPLTLAVPSDFDPDIHIDFLPTAEVTITGRIEARKETRAIGPIQITWSIPDEIQRDYVMVAQQERFRVNIDVTGPRDRIEQLDPANILGLIEVYARDRDDPGPGKAIIRRVRFVLPPDFADCALAPQAQPYEIRFKLEPRIAAANPAGAD